MAITPSGFRRAPQILKKLEREEIYGFGATCEYVMYDVIEAFPGFVAGLGSGVAHRILDHPRVVSRQLEILECKFMDYRVNLYDRCVYAMRHKGGWRGTNAEAAGREGGKNVREMPGQGRIAASRGEEQPTSRAPLLGGLGPAWVPRLA